LRTIDEMLIVKSKKGDKPALTKEQMEKYVKAWGEREHLLTINTTSDNAINCPNCKNHMDDCNCTCNYCGESSKCTCAIGSKATGG
jgi:hypothetical protein